MTSRIKLQTESVFQIPLGNYPADFTFIVNGENYETNKLAADLISTKIATIHRSDPTLSEYSITTTSKGSFNTFLRLLTFEDQPISENEIAFISEVVEKLGTEKIQINIATVEISLDNVFELLNLHIKNPIFYSNQISQEIEFLSVHFYELNDTLINKAIKLDYTIIEKIISNENLSLLSEDQLMIFIDKLCSINTDYSNLYSYVYFNNISKERIEWFFNNFDIDSMTRETWMSLSKLLIGQKKEKVSETRYRNKESQFFKEVPFSNNDLKGIFNFFKTNSNIKSEVNVTFSSLGNTDSDANLITDIENTDSDFYTDNEKDSWICFEFKNHRVIPTNYTIKSCKDDPNQYHLKNWIIEGSKDGKSWMKIDEQTNCSYLNGSFYNHTFPIQEKGEFKFIRIRITGSTWLKEGNYTLNICSMEFYGNII
ncbi:hypothetical protein M9Y10_025092 [Tritrichomonas musculus]|uniref:F5/8 type C domain-containing protein n=1 Tax=Tritrichomonas musculus TaxID=1915356 RepID=A0ABR2HAI0_9EUKA